MRLPIAPLGQRVTEVAREGARLYLDRIRRRIQALLPDGTTLDLEHTGRRGVAGGYASLDASGKVPSAQLPSSSGGTPAHADLTDLAWTDSGHTGTGLAGFSGAGEAGNVAIGTGLDLSGGVLEVDTAAISTRTYAEGLAAAAEAAAEATAATLATAAQEAAEATAATLATAAQEAAEDASQPLDADLTALAALTTTGLLVRIGAASYELRTLQGGPGVSIANGSGVGGNPTINFSGGTGRDDNPTTSYSIAITPSNATMVSRDGGITVRSAAAGNLATRRATAFSGAFADFYTTNFNVLQTRWSMSGAASVSVRWVTGSSVAATCRYKFGFTAGGVTATDAETAGRDTAIFRYVTGLAHTKWMCYSQNSAGSEETDSGVTVFANTEYLMEIQQSSTQTVFYINGTAVATHTTRMPSTSQDLGFQGGVYSSGKTIYVVGVLYNLAWA